MILLRLCILPERQVNLCAGFIGFGVAGTQLYGFIGIFHGPFGHVFAQIRIGAVVQYQRMCRFGPESQRGGVIVDGFVEAVAVKQDQAAVDERFEIFGIVPDGGIVALNSAI